MPERAASQTEPRTLQHFDESAEAAVLSAAMLKQTALDEVRELLEPHDFFSGAHRIVYEAICTLEATGATVDVITVAHELRAAGRLNQVGGSAFLAQLTDATPTVANVVEHARLVRRLARLRRVSGTLHDLAMEARRVETRGDVKGFIERCEAAIFTASVDGTDRQTSALIGEVMSKAIADLDPRKPRQMRGVTTGFWELDTLSGGFKPGELWYVAARSGVGKTALSLSFARAVSASGHHAVIFNQEMEMLDLGHRILSDSSGVAHELITSNTLSLAQYERVVAAGIEIGRHPLKLDETTALTPARIRSRLRRHASELRAKFPGARLTLVVVDYVQLLSDDSSEGSRNDQLERISRALKVMAGEFGCTIVALSQLKRADRSAQHAAPTYSDLRGSGALEQDGDKVLLIHRERGEDDGDDRGEATLILDKNRGGKRGRIQVIWQPWCVRYTSREQGFGWADAHERGPESEGRS